MATEDRTLRTVRRNRLPFILLTVCRLNRLNDRILRWLQIRRCRKFYHLNHCLYDVHLLAETQVQEPR